MTITFWKRDAFRKILTRTKTMRRSLTVEAAYRFPDGRFISIIFDFLAPDQCILTSLIGNVEAAAATATFLTLLVTYSAINLVKFGHESR